MGDGSDNRDKTPVIKNFRAVCFEQAALLHRRKGNDKINLKLQTGLYLSQFAASFCYANNCL